MSVTDVDVLLPLDEIVPDSRCESCETATEHLGHCAVKETDDIEGERYDHFWTIVNGSVGKADQEELLDRQLDRAIKKTRELVDRFLVDPPKTFVKLMRWLRETNNRGFGTTHVRLQDRGHDAPLLDLLRSTKHHDSKMHRIVERHALEILTYGVCETDKESQRKMLDAGIIALLFGENGEGGIPLDDEHQAYKMLERVVSHPSASALMRPAMEKMIADFTGRTIPGRFDATRVLPHALASFENAELFMNRPGALAILMERTDGDWSESPASRMRCRRVLSSYPAFRSRLIDAGILDVIAFHFSRDRTNDREYANALRTLVNLAATVSRAREFEYYRDNVFHKVDSFLARRLHPGNSLEDAIRIGGHSLQEPLEFARLLTILSSDPKVRAYFSNAEKLDALMSVFKRPQDDWWPMETYVGFTDAFTNFIVANDASSPLVVSAFSSEDVVKKTVELLRRGTGVVRRSTARLIFALAHDAAAARVFIAAGVVRQLLSVLLPDETDDELVECVFGALANVAEHDSLVVSARARHLLEYAARFVYRADTEAARKQAFRAFVSVVRRVAGPSGVRDLSVDSAFIPLATGGAFGETRRLINDFNKLKGKSFPPSFDAAVEELRAARTHAERVAPAADVARIADEIASAMPQDCEFLGGPTISSEMLRARSPYFVVAFSGTWMRACENETTEKTDRRTIKLDASAGALDVIATYLRRGTLTVDTPFVCDALSPAIVLETLVLAHEYELDGLQAVCEAALLDDVCRETVDEILLEAVEETLTFVQAPVLRAVCECVRIDTEFKKRTSGNQKRVRFNFENNLEGSSTSSSSS